MAERKIYIVDENGELIEEIIEFKYFPGFSKIQKIKTINSLHEEISKKYKGKILEISRNSPDEYGAGLSAFNLNINIMGINVNFENFFQASKVFENGGPYTDLLFCDAVQAKKDDRIRNSGKLLGFEFNNQAYPIEPKTLFYNYFYSYAFFNNKKSIEQLNEYSIFTDIEFNHVKSFNCQAYSAAILVSLFRKGILYNSLLSIDNYKKNVYK